MGQILQSMLDARLTAMPESADTYINMVESRQELLNNLAQLSNEAGFREACGDEETRMLLEEITKIHSQQQTQAKGIVNEIRKSIKDTRTEKAISQIYTRDSYVAGSFFDKTN